MPRLITPRNAVLAIAALGAVTWLAVHLRREIAIDRCLDNGGRWNYSASVCEMRPAG
jgi:hypothetical protein